MDKKIEVLVKVLYLFNKYQDTVFLKKADYIPDDEAIIAIMYDTNDNEYKIFLELNDDSFPDDSSTDHVCIIADYVIDQIGDAFDLPGEWKKRNVIYINIMYHKYQAPHETMPDDSNLRRGHVLDTVDDILYFY